ncbi:hypothetical protein FHY55_02530 [Oceanicola sp. D3]|uniref:COG4315 family predicted lipoprotein n=1 Tax=Oceanicola sp. D3 TaxID=2587163 RepID=UPI00111E799D|nr:hypothetical protein [Oceanicola sp. D3]QDC08189.1 hypothetical protein FHY55_02530 [Oceanicola sp. D3]
MIKNSLLAFLLIPGVALADAHGGAAVGTFDIDGQRVLVNAAQMTLYTFDKDDGATSSCYDGCAGSWPPVLAEAGAALPEGFALTERRDGTRQVTYNGQPLYLWAGDSAPGEMTGDGVGGVWHVAKP